MEKDYKEKLTYVFEKLGLNQSELEYCVNIGEGAWHEVYKIKGKHRKELVVRIKKEKAYGEIQEFNKNELLSEYESTKLYYKQANECYSQFCPKDFDYFIDHKTVFTVESFMGKSLKLNDLNNTQAYDYGVILGEFFKKMHNEKPKIKGIGNLVWDGKSLIGTEKLDVEQIWKKENDFYLDTLEKLIKSLLTFDRQKVSDRIHSIIKYRRKQFQKISLVNQDVTPENIIFTENSVSLIDPYPKLDFEFKFAGYFFFCYKFLLPAYSSAPRYIENEYEKNRLVLSSIAEGFANQYTNDDQKEYKKLIDEYLLWVLLEAYDHYSILKKGNINQKIKLKMGDKNILKNRLDLCLMVLQGLA
ncbi:hypothetical protein J5Y03_11785 [Bacillus sp. RG28]|uniref:Uncharacterized protein n=1 Tax=Gottfriedia endophytica TaxID=2820819 RepID=A0A940SJV4_9BACI|nr:hypothetical protein [Gottfriedia endophytica]MBP0725851.1 hypothetical protein [Gottfriedia endophytica]